jgi:hypothetical protein
MLVRIVRQMVNRSTVSKVNMIDNSGLLKSVKRSIDSGEMYLGIEAFELSGNIVRRQVSGPID